MLFPLLLSGTVGELAEHAPVETVFGLHCRMYLFGGDGLTHLFIIGIFEFCRFHFQAVDFLDDVVIVPVRGIGWQASFLEFHDFPVDAPLLVVHLVEDGEKGRGFRRGEAGFAHDETFQAFHEILGGELAVALLGGKRCYGRQQRQEGHEKNFLIHK